MWNGGTQARTGNKYRYDFPAPALCWSELAGLAVRVPCDYAPYIEANYGSGWRVPQERWDWKRSPPNVRPNGRWPEATWAHTVQCAACAHPIDHGAGFG